MKQRVSDTRIEMSEEVKERRIKKTRETILHIADVYDEYGLEEKAENIRRQIN